MHSHQEEHIKSPVIVKDLVIGLSDGLTVPFALAAGLSGAVQTTGIIVTAGLAEIAAGAIAMGLGGYLAAKTESQHYQSERSREAFEIKNLPQVEAEEVAVVLREFGVPELQVPIVVDAIRSDPQKWLEFMMRFELGLEQPDPRRLFYSPLTIGGAYVIGGLIPLLPYMYINDVNQALFYSAIMTAISLFTFGALKGHFTGFKVGVSALQTLFVGGAAATAAYVIAKLISLE